MKTIDGKNALELKTSPDAIDFIKSKMRDDTYFLELLEDSLEKAKTLAKAGLKEELKKSDAPSPFS